MKTPFYADLGDLGEDERIAMIGRVVEAGNVTAFVVEDDAKADRYLAKLKKRFKVSVLSRGKGPVKDTVFVRLGPYTN